MAFLALQSVPNAASFCLPYKFTQSTKKCKLGIRFDYIFLLQQTRWITRRWRNLGNDELIFLIRERSFQCHPRPWGGKVLQDGRVGRKSGCTFITVFFSIQALQHKLLLWSFHQTFGISNGYYPNHKNMAMYSFVAFSRIRDEYSAVPQACFLHSLRCIWDTVEAISQAGRFQCVPTMEHSALTLAVGH